MGKKVLQNDASKEEMQSVPSCSSATDEMQSVPSCSSATDEMRVWMFPQFFRFIQKQSSCDSVQVSEHMKQEVGRIIQTPPRPLLFPVNRLGAKSSDSH